MDNKTNIIRYNFPTHAYYRIIDDNSTQTRIDIKSTRSDAEIVINIRDEIDVRIGSGKTFWLDLNIHKHKTLKNALEAFNISQLLNQMHGEGGQYKFQDVDKEDAKKQVIEARSKNLICEYLEADLLGFLRDCGNSKLGWEEWREHLSDSCMLIGYDPVSLEEEICCAVEISEFWQSWFNETWVPFVEQLEI